MKYKVLQICYGKIYPPYISAYALRVKNIIPDIDITVSTAGMIFHDQHFGNIKEYRSILLTIYSIFKRNRYLEIALSKGEFIRHKYIKDVQNFIKDSDIIIFEGLWQYNLFRDFVSKKFIVYDAHNVESNIRKNTKYYNYTFELEKELVERANLVLTVSNEDYKTFKEEFNCKTVFLATHILGNKIYSWEGINSKNIVFIGSIYKPNIDAVEYIMSIASELPDFQFSIIGNVNLHRFSHVPKNVKFYGMIGEDEKNRILSSSIMALNPVFEGGGRNVKMVDYIMHGLPIISTTIGVRGFSGYDLNGAIIVSDNIKEKLQEVVKNKELLKSLSENVYKLVNEIIQQEGSINTESIIKKEYEKWKYLEQ